MNLTFYAEIALTVLLIVTIGYCVILERRLAAVRKGQDGLKSTIGELNAAITGAGASLRALKAAAGESAEMLDSRLSAARKLNDELAVLTASGERIAQRMDRAVVPGTTPRAPIPIIKPSNAHLPSGSVMNRLDALKAAR
jgi:hypothetical protein